MFKVIFLPLNVTSHLQPMDQSINRNSEKAVPETAFKETFIRQSWRQNKTLKYLFWGLVQNMRNPLLNTFMEFK